MIPRIVSRKAYDEMLDKKNKTIADLMKTLEAINAVFATHTNDQINVDWIRSKVGQAIEKAKEGNAS